MEVKAGYKKTEVGLIPDDWDVVPLAGLCRSICDGTHFTPRYVQQGVPFYSVENVTANDFVNTKFISESEHARLIKRCRPERGDILMTRITAGVIGDTRILDWDVNASIYVSLALLKPNARVVPEYLYRYSRSSAFVRDVEKRALVNATPKKINMRDIGAVPIPVPPKEEQIAIAKVLEDSDALVGGMDRLIAKKRDVKQAVMQHLLTGARRLPGFTDEWTRKRFGDLFHFLRTANNPRADLSTLGTIGYIHYGDIHTTTSAFLNCSESSLPLIASERVGDVPLVESGDLIMADASEDYEGIGKCIEVQNTAGRKIVAGLHTLLLRGRRELLADGFKGYLQFIPSVKTSLIRFATGISVYGVSKKNVQSVEVELPNIDEQRAIAIVLSDMDAEVAVLEQQRDKTRLLKQGMIQELLTGRTRLA